MTKEELLKTVGHFTWGFSSKFFIETEVGNFIWSDPEYNGDNSLTYFKGSYEEWTKEENIPFGRDKGFHIIKNYCGEDVVLKAKVVRKIDRIKSGFYRVIEGWKNE
jgi:hypothetical protein